MFLFPHAAFHLGNYVMKIQRSTLYLFTLPQRFQHRVTLSLLLSILLAMEELDGDEVRVSSRGRLAERDIVQVIITILLNLAG